MFRLMLVLYNLFFPLLFVLYAPFYLAHLIKRGNFLSGFGERFGLYGRAKRQRLRELDGAIWIHAVSVGETVAALSFIRQWNTRQPGLSFVLSTTTSTGQQLARTKAPENVTPIYCPIDWFVFVWLALHCIRPGMLVIFEVEIWPTLITMARRRGCPITLVNCRMSDRTAQGYYNYRAVFRPLLGKFRWIGVQTAEDLERVKRVVGDRTPVEVCNNMKFDQTPDQEAAAVGPWLERAFGSGERLVLTAASTHAGEEEIVLRTMRAVLPDFPRVKLLLVPRHVERLPELTPLLQESGLPHVRLTALRDGAAAPAGCQILVVDTTGELMSFLAHSDIVFVGKSLGGNEGGHNIIEPAIFGKAILFGSHMENFRRIATIFKQRDAAIEVADEGEFAAAVRRLLDDPAERQRLATASRRTVEEQRGAIERTIRALESYR